MILRFSRVVMMSLSVAIAASAQVASPPPIELPPPPSDAAVDAKPVKPVAMAVQRGSGPVPMILIPTISCDWSVWDEFMTRNRSRYTMYAITLPGMVGTVAPELLPGESWESIGLTKNAVKAIIKFIEDGQIDRPVIMGHGYGGQLAMLVATQRPDLVRAIISVDGMPVAPMADPSHRPGLEERKAIIRRSTARDLMKDSDDEWKARSFSNTLSLVTSDVRARDLALMMNKTDRGVAVYYYLESLLVDVTEALKTLKVPMLCIATIPPQPPPPEKYVREIWARALGTPPNTTLTYYPSCRHYVMDDNPEQLDTDVELFVAGKKIPWSLGSGAASQEQPQPAEPAPAPAQE